MLQEPPEKTNFLTTTLRRWEFKTLSNIMTYKTPLCLPLYGTLLLAKYDKHMCCCIYSRYNRARLERLRRAREEADFEKIFKQSFWSYSKSMLKQPLSVLEGEKGDELEDTALKLFYTIQQHAGMGNFEETK